VPPSRLPASISIASVLVLYAVFRLVEQFGAVAWSTSWGEGLLKILVWVVPSVLVVSAAYRISPAGALEELGLLANPIVGYALGMIAVLPVLATSFAGLRDLAMARLAGDVAMGPFAEEVLFRGVLFRQLYRRAGRRPLRAMVVSALVFGFAHLANIGSLGAAEDAAQAAALVGTATLGGLLFAWLTLRWNSVWPAVGLHTFLNLSWDLTATDASRSVLVMRVASIALAVVLTWRFSRTNAKVEVPDSRF
jgi:CAAX protease family protein